MECSKVCSGVRKVKKKKHVKDDRIKQAVKKMRLLEKALATSAAIRTELEKKKHLKDELDCFKQAEKKKRRLEKALATSAAISTELEKKKHVKYELDRFKQAEKKKRRLEKALATSAAIRTELEKKKLKKQEEQQMLDEEGAANAEAVALQVLLGKDLDDSSNVMLKKDEGFEPWDFASKFNLLTRGTQSYLPHQDLSRQSAEEIERISNNHRSEYMWNGWREQGYCTQYPEPSVRGLNPSYSYEKGWGTADMSAAAVIAEQAISSLRIAEDENVDTFMPD